MRRSQSAQMFWPGGKTFNGSCAGWDGFGSGADTCLSPDRGFGTGTLVTFGVVGAAICGEAISAGK